MEAEGQVIEADGRLRRRRMSFVVLPAYHRRIEEDGLCDGIAGKPDNVQEREVRRQTLGGLALDVEDGLRVEADGPRGEVEPATETTSGRRWQSDVWDRVRSVESGAYREEALASSTT